MAKEIIIKIETTDLMEAKVKENLLQGLANLPVDVLEKLNQMKTEKAINNLRSKWALIKAFC